jgi:shikimate kinase
VSATVVIVGPPGSGKSTIGSVVADSLDLECLDTDLLVEAEAQMPVADIFLMRGEADFRRVEEQVAIAALQRPGGVVALGSGAIESPGLRSLLADHFVVQLRLGAAEAAKRAGIAGARPAQLGNVRSQWNKSMARREPMYAEVADLVIETGSAGIDAPVEEIVAELSSRSRQSPTTMDSSGESQGGGGISD